MKIIFLNSGELVPPAGSPNAVVMKKYICYGEDVKNIGDVVSLHIDNKPSIYARIEGIEADIKPKWYQVRLLFLGFPPQEVTWILREEYIDGAPFTMKDIPMQIVGLPSPGCVPSVEPEEPDESHDKKNDSENNRGEVISLAEMRAKKKGEDTEN